MSLSGAIDQLRVTMHCYKQPNHSLNHRTQQTVNYLLTQMSNCLLTHPPTHSPPHSLTHLTNLPTHSPPSLTHSLTHIHSPHMSLGGCTGRQGGHIPHSSLGCGQVGTSCRSVPCTPTERQVWMGQVAQSTPLHNTTHSTTTATSSKTSDW